jgi:hypothetical protein
MAAPRPMGPDRIADWTATLVCAILLRSMYRAELVYNAPETCDARDSGSTVWLRLAFSPLNF